MKILVDAAFHLVELVRLYDADIRALPAAYVREQIAFVLRDFRRYTAAETLAFGSWPHLLGQPARIEAVARRAAVNEMIESLPRGYYAELYALHQRRRQAGLEEPSAEAANGPGAERG